MTTLDLSVLKCPYCSQLMISYELMSYTVNEAEYWSDGKTGFGIPSSGRIGICPSCSKEFWKEDNKLDIDRMDIQEELPSCMDTGDLGWHLEDDGKEREIAYYIGLIEKGFASKDEYEIYIRLRLRWAINDLIRYMPEYKKARKLGMLSDIRRKRREARNLFDGYVKIRTENLKQLIYLYIKSGEVDFIVLAEMYREAGKFVKALEVLYHTQEPAKTYSKLKRLIRRKKKGIYKL